MDNTYKYAKEIYKNLGVDTDQAIQIVSSIPLSIQCWQGDDIKGFMFKEQALTGGIQVTGSYPNKATTPDQLRSDLEMALSMVPGSHKINLHAIYADTDEKIDLDEIEPKHFKKWVDWAKQRKVGLDFNPTCFSHEKSQDGFTLSSINKETKDFWIKHVKLSRKIGAYFSKELNQKSVVNLWIPDGYKDSPYDRLSPRVRLKEALDEIYKEKLNIVDTLESKLFGIGSEAYTVGSHEFYLSYAIKNNLGICLDTGHFHPTESVADKISAIKPFVKDMLLHVSRPMRWDSDHVVILDDETQKLAEALVRNDFLNQVHIGFDYFDASISRISAWVIGVRSFQIALLKALLEPKDLIKKMEDNQDYSQRLYYQEMLKSLPYGLVYDELLRQSNVAGQLEWFNQVRDYENKLER